MLELGESFALTTLPAETASGLTSLRQLLLMACCKLRALPAGLERLPALEILDVRMCAASTSHSACVSANLARVEALAEIKGGV